MVQTKFKRFFIKDKLFNKRRLIILNEETFEETFSLRLTIMNVFVLATVGAIVIIFVTTYIIAFTALREYIPGYSSFELRRKATELSIKSDSLSMAIKKNEAYIKSIKRVLTNDLDFETTTKKPIEIDN